MLELSSLSSKRRSGRPRRIPMLLIALLAPVGAAGDSLLVGSAVSLREAATEIGRRYAEQHPDAAPTFTFGASSVLALQLRAGAPIDVLLFADERIVDGLEAEGLVPADGRFTLARNRLVVLTAADFGAEVGSAGDLLRPEVRRIALPALAVPVGRYAREWLDRRGLLEQIEPRLVQTEHARATLAAVDYGHADVAIVYVTDARMAHSARVAFEIPDAEQPRIRYEAALVKGTPRAEAARRFLDFLRSRSAAEALSAAGFIPAAGRAGESKP